MRGEDSNIAKERDSNVELFRIIMMGLIVAHHYVVNSGLLGAISEPPFTWQHYFLYTFGMWGKIGINCFVLITGYFMCKSNITARKFLKLFLEVLFYNFIIYIIFVISGYETLSFKGVYHALMVIKDINADFVDCFLIYYLLIPFMNILVNNLSEYQHRVLILICLLFFVVLNHFPGVEYVFNYVGWFCVLHVIASYIRFYEEKLFNIATNREYILITGGGAFAILLVFVQLLAIEHDCAIGWAYKWVCDCNAIGAVITSVMLFVGFKNLKMKSSKWINMIASSTFGVLLIHANSNTMRQWLWQDVCRCTEWFGSPYLLLHALGGVMAIFVICVLIDQIRIRLIEKPTMSYVGKILIKYGIK